MVPQTKFSSLPAPSIQTCRLQIVRKNVWFEVIPQLQLASQTTFFLPSSLSPVFKKKKGGKEKWPGILMIDFHKTVHVACRDKKSLSEV